MTSRLLQTNTDDLRELSTKLSGHAEAVATIDASTGPRDAAAATPNTQFGAGCTAIADPIAHAYRGVSGQVRQMAGGAVDGADSYDATEAALAAQLGRYEAGVR